MAPVYIDGIVNEAFNRVLFLKYTVCLLFQLCKLLLRQHLKCKSGGWFESFFDAFAICCPSHGISL